MKKKIYVASSWRNEHQQMLVEHLRNLGYEVYDFKHPNDGLPGFQWSRIDNDWQNWDMDDYRDALEDSYAQFGYNRDFKEEMFKYLSHYEPRNTHHLPQLRA